MKKEITPDYTIAFAGNPNVGKTSIFNNLTGLHQHTGNWPGKTVANAYGTCKYKDKNFALIDLPGTYSLMANSGEEEIARDYIESGNSDLTVIVVDATCLERNLNLVIQILELTRRVVLCVNLLDEAEKKSIKIDLELLSNLLGVPVVGTIAHKPQTMQKLLSTIYFSLENPDDVFHDFPIIEQTDKAEDYVSTIIAKAEEIKNKVCTYTNEKYNERDRKIDKILTSKKFGIPIMLLFLALILWITIVVSNYPSSLLSTFFEFIQGKIVILFNFLNVPTHLSNLLINGMYKTVTWVIAVMLPPMAIFFPLFTLLEDLGYLPRIAFNLDNYFKRACTTGKQALTMCMGFGCNAVRSNWM